MTCRASSIESADYLTSWTARLKRSAPLPFQSLPQMMNPFVTGKAAPVDGGCFNAPFEFTQSDVIDPITGKDRKITNLANPLGDTQGRLCKYLCVSWQVIN